MHMHQQSNECEALYLIARPNPGTISRRGEERCDPFPHFALLDSDCTRGCILAKEDACTMQAFSSPTFAFVSISCVGPRVRDDGSPPCLFGLFGLFSERELLDARRARSGQGPSGGRTTDDQLGGMALACPPRQGASLGRMPPSLPPSSRTKYIGTAATGESRSDISESALIFQIA